MEFLDSTQYLLTRTVKKLSENSEDKIKVTHTKIGSKVKNGKHHGGSYNIPDDQWCFFMDLYYNDVFNNNYITYLTETQIPTVSKFQEISGPLIIDFDFRYEGKSKRFHTLNDITSIISLYLNKLQEMFVFDNTEIFIYVTEKDEPNHLEHYTKDGIHMVFGLQCDHFIQNMIRDSVLQDIDSLFSHLPITNTWSEVLDAGITNGTTNWQLFGSRKPDNEPYKLKYIFGAKINQDSIETEEESEVFTISQYPHMEMFNEKVFKEMSVEYKYNPKFPFTGNSEKVNEYNRLYDLKFKQKSKITKKTASKVVLLTANTPEDSEHSFLKNIKNQLTLKKEMDKILNSLQSNELYIKEVHEYTQILPAKYYEPGSHLLNREVAFALKHTSDKHLFLSWIMLRAKASDFDFNEIEQLHYAWINHFNKREGLTHKSIMYWARIESPEEYIKIKKSNIGYYLIESIETLTEYDFAKVVYQTFKDRYASTQLGDKHWFMFYNNRWHVDKGVTLRKQLSEEVYEIYKNKLKELHESLKKITDSIEDSSNDETALTRFEKEKEKTTDLISKTSQATQKLKKTASKNNIYKECFELFYDNQFIRKLNSDKWLLGFDNGVVDFRSKVFRSGIPEDYITKSTCISYIPVLDETHTQIKNDIIEFMSKLFPVQELNKYMWEHLASCLIGENITQTFNIYTGSGSNGKSMLTDLMGHILGEYKGTVPITLVTEKRVGVGSTSSEIMQLKGVRYAVMQEPSKNMKLNEGIMKELVGGDPLQARALYMESETFDPQFTLVVCTNVLPTISSNDDGTWRRIRVVPYMSKFVDTLPEASENLKNEDNEFIFKKDKRLKEKFKIWAPVFIHMLVQICFDKCGDVCDCEIVTNESRKYRESQDYITRYISTSIERCDETNYLKTRELSNDFKIWVGENVPFGKGISTTELTLYMNKKFGNATINGWKGLKLKDMDTSHF